MAEIDINKVYGIVYSITNKESKRVYVGQTMTNLFSEDTGFWRPYGMHSRFLAHCSQAGRALAYCDLYEDLQKHGQHGFDLVEICRVPALQIEELDAKETEYIEKLNALHPNGYNKRKNTPVLSPTKKKIFELTGKTVERTEQQIEKQQRNQQKTIPKRTYKSKVEFFKDLEIESIRIVPIKHHNQIGEIRVLVNVSDEKSAYRINFADRNVSVSVKKALEFAREIFPIEDGDERVFVHPSIKNMKEGIVEEPYKYQERLDRFSKMNPTKVHGKDYKNTNCGNRTYVLFFRGDGPEAKTSFGGKKTTLDQSYKDAVEFVNKLPYVNTVKLDLVVPKKSQ